MKRAYLVSAAMLMTAAVSFGQNFNPTVEVTNTYQQNPSEIHKPLLEMNVPDSLLRFDLDFDYEVFSKPYQGAYSFKPYMLDMQPRKDAWRGRKLYLKAGAGYSLHPQLEFVFSPEQGGPVQMSVYASHKSYFGKYHDIQPEPGDGTLRLKKSGNSFTGHDALTVAGFDGHYNWDRTILSFGVGYYGVAAKDTVVSRNFSAVDFSARVRSNNDSESYFLYDVGFRGRVATDRLKYKSLPFTNGMAVDGQNESSFSLNGLAGQVIDSNRSLLAGFEAETVSCGRFYDGNMGRVALIPRYRLKSGRWDLDLGVRFEYVFRKDASDSLCFSKMNGGAGQVAYPEVHVSFTAGKSIAFYADATGGSRLDTYSQQIAGNHHMNPSFLVSPVYGRMTSLIDNTVENVNARIGARGSVASSFSYDVKGGAAVYDNALMESGIFNAEGKLLPSVAYSDISVIYADALLGWNSDRWDVDAAFSYRKTFFQEEEAQNNGFTLPEFSGRLDAKYDISSRLYAGISVEASSWREGKCGTVSVPEDDVMVRVPGYVDLGVNCGYRFNRKLELWLESGNLLFQTVQRNPFYAEKGLWVTAGLSLNL